MYIINDYQLITAVSNLYLCNAGKGAKIANQQLAAILFALQKQKRLEISDEELQALANQQQIDIDSLKKTLIEQLKIVKPMLSRKFPLIYLNIDDTLIATLLQNTLAKEYQVQIVPASFLDFNPHALVIFYRQNYSHADFKILYQQLNEDIYLVTAGIIHQLLFIDNLYFKDSGLPTHFSNLHQLMAYLHSNISATKNNWLLFYRDIIKNKMDEFPNPQINACQQGYIAYCIYQFISQFTNLWQAPTPLDQVNCFWQADLTNFTIHSEAAIHSPFSEYDMKLDLLQKEQVA